MCFCIYQIVGFWSTQLGLFIYPRISIYINRYFLFTLTYKKEKNCLPFFPLLPIRGIQGMNECQGPWLPHWNRRKGFGEMVLYQMSGISETIEGLRLWPHLTAISPGKSGRIYRCQCFPPWWHAWSRNGFLYSLHRDISIYQRRSPLTTALSWQWGWWKGPQIVTSSPESKVLAQGACSSAQSHITLGWAKCQAGGLSFLFYSWFIQRLWRWLWKGTSLVLLG